MAYGPAYQQWCCAECDHTLGDLIDGVRTCTVCSARYGPAGERLPDEVFCPECLPGDEDPAPWCDCRPDENPCPRGRACKQRAHAPGSCPTRHAVRIGSVDGTIEPAVICGALTWHEGADYGWVCILPVRAERHLACPTHGPRRRPLDTVNAIPGGYMHPLHPRAGQP